MTARRSLVLLIGLAVAVAIGVVADIVAGRGASGVGTWLLIVGSVGASILAGTVTAFQATISRRLLLLRRPRLRRSAELAFARAGTADVAKVTLVITIASIESAANQLLSTMLGGRSRTLYQTRSELRRLGVWSDSDLEVFDRALSIRNGIVHGDVIPHGEESISTALADADRLAAKLRRRLDQAQSDQAAAGNDA
jgi:uncharacterized protein YutE (UPF0331/DUF86 family)